MSMLHCFEVHLKLFPNAFLCELYICRAVFVNLSCSYSKVLYIAELLKVQSRIVSVWIEDDFISY